MYVRGQEGVRWREEDKKRFIAQYGQEAWDKAVQKGSEQDNQEYNQYKINQARRVAIQTYAKQIREAPLLLKKVTRFSEDHAITLDSAITYEASRMAGYIKSEK